MTWSLDNVPTWALSALWTAVTLGGSYLIGHLARALVVPRLRKLASQTKARWDDIVIGEATRRVPFWALLIGAWLALGHWAMRDDVRALIEQVLKAAAGISITLALASMVVRLVVAYQSAVAPDVPVTGLTQNLARIAVLVIGALMIANALGLDITAALTALGVGGLAVALALQEPLSNLFAGFFISVAGQVRVGDYIKLDSGVEGHVVDLNWRSTRIRTLADSAVIVPNAKLSQAVVTNFGAETTELAVPVPLGVEYTSDLTQVERVVVEVAQGVMRDVDGGVPSFEPVVRFQAFGDSAIELVVVVRARHFVDQALLKHELIKRLHARFRAEGIRVPFPTRVLSARDPIPVVVRSATS